MRALIIAALIWLAATPTRAEEDTHTGAFFQRYCGDDGKLAACTFYMAGYMHGLIDGIRRSDEAATDFQQRCKSGVAVFCQVPPSTKVNMEYFGCRQEASKLPQSALQQLILASLKKHPERLRWDLGSVYRAAIDETFGCSAQAEP